MIPDPFSHPLAARYAAYLFELLEYQYLFNFAASTAGHTPALSEVQW
jgi:hypothetical protein